MGDGQWAKKVNMVFAGNQAGNFDDGFEDVMGKADAAAGDGSLLDGTLTAPDIESLRKEKKGKAQRTRTRTRRRSRAKMKNYQMYLKMIGLTARSKSGRPSGHLHRG